MILVKNPCSRPTLDEILSSDFMKLGEGILKELPKVCAKRAPSKRDLQINTTLVTNSIEKKNSANLLNVKIILEDQ
jgi:hypothetical protein